MVVGGRQAVFYHYEYYLKLICVARLTIESILAIMQFMFQSTYFNKWFGLAYHDITIAGNSVVTTVSDKLLRPYGTLPHPNILGGFLAVAAIIALWLIWQPNQPLD